ncbi:MAG: heme A synthase, partial [Gammaproteobacteria bacterium]|nr:heme A synthase [Gammaproteobacteria bacterium]
PTCQGQIWPEADFAEGFVIWRELGVDYEGGVLHMSARVAIHLAHRIGAVVTFLVLGSIFILLMRAPFNAGLRAAAGVAGVLLLIQLGLGIGIVLTHLPLAGATAHNAVAALLLLSIVTLNHLARPKKLSP